MFKSDLALLDYKEIEELFAAHRPKNMAETVRLYKDYQHRKFGTIQGSDSAFDRALQEDTERLVDKNRRAS